jgi:hypothetical protein
MGTLMESIWFTYEVDIEASFFSVMLQGTVRMKQDGRAYTSTPSSRTCEKDYMGSFSSFCKQFLEETEN